MTTFPARHISGQLIWSQNGGVFAVWRVTPTTYQYLDMNGKRDLHVRTRDSLRVLGVEWMLLSLAAGISATSVVERMVEGVDLERNTGWIDVAQATLDRLATVEMYERTHWIVVKLSRGGRGSVRRRFAAATDGVGSAFGIVAPAVRESERASCQREADTITGRLAGLLKARAATSEEILWMYARAPRRGLGEPLLQEFTSRPRWNEVNTGPAGSDSELRGPSLAAFQEFTTFEGGEPGTTDGPKGLRRRVVEVQLEMNQGEGTRPVRGYQSFVALSDMPPAFEFPGTEWFLASCQIDFPVDWMIRSTVVENSVARGKAKKRKRELDAQADEYAATGAIDPGVEQARDAADRELADLAANPHSSSIQAAIVFAVWSEDAAECEDRVDKLRDALNADEFILERPTGAQTDLFWAMWPGADTPHVCKDYTQYLSPAALSGGMPFAGSDVGDPTGMLFAFSLDGGTARPVLLDATRGPIVQRDANVLYQGGMGGGKSQSMKRAGADVIERGGRLVIVDRTPMGEWVRFARAVARRPAIITIDETSEISLDPLAIFPPKSRATIAAGFLNQLTGTAPRDLEGLALSEAVEAVSQRNGRLVDVTTELLRRGETDPDSRVVGRKLMRLQAKTLGQVAFGDGKKLSLDAADVIVFHCPDLQLPDELAQSSDYARAHMADEIVYSQALVYLIAAVARHVAFEDLDRFTALVVDEAYILSQSPQGRALLEVMLRDGRKHDHAVWLSTQEVTDIPKELLSLLSVWLIFRQARTAAARTLAARAMECDDWLLDTITQFKPGQALLCDLDGRSGLIQVLQPVLERHRLAFETNPTRGQRGAEDTHTPSPDRVPVHDGVPVHADALTELDTEPAYSDVVPSELAVDESQTENAKPTRAPAPARAKRAPVRAPAAPRATRPRRTPSKP